MKLNDERREEPETIETIVDGLVRVPLRTPTLPPATRTNSFLVRGQTGWWLVDVGPSDERELESLAGAIEEHVANEPLAGLFLTHHHPDHVGGLRWFVERYDAPVVSGRATWERHHHNVAHPWRVIEGDRVSLGGLDAIATDGHAPDHYSLLTANNHLVAGDILSGMGTIVIAPPDGNMRDYYQSLEKLIAMNFSAIHPAHGPSAEQPRERLQAYLDHRRAREQRVADALTADFQKLGVLVETAYADVDPALHGFARGTLRAYLNMMQERGDAERSADDRWRRAR